MNSYPDPMQETPESLLIEEPEYREYPTTPPQPHIPIYPTAPSYPPGYPPIAGTPVPPMQVPPYPYGPARQGPQALTPPSAPTKKASSRGWIILLGSIGLAILILGSVLIYALTQLSSPHNSSITPSNTNPSQPGVVKVGESLTVNGLTATLLSVRPLTGDGKINPDAGNKFMVVNIQLQNDQKTSQVYNSFDFHVFNGDNQERDVDSIAPSSYTANQQLSEDDLAPNDTITGDLIIQVPVNDHNVKLGWNPGSAASSDSTYEWDLGL